MAALDDQALSGPRPPRSLGRFVRVLLHVCLASPFSLVTIPLFLGLFVHIALHGFTALPNPFTRSWRSNLTCAACMTTLATFAILAIGHLTIAIRQAWRGNNAR